MKGTCSIKTLHKNATQAAKKMTWGELSGKSSRRTGPVSFGGGGGGLRSPARIFYSVLAQKSSGIAQILHISYLQNT